MKSLAEYRAYDMRVRSEIAVLGGRLIHGEPERGPADCEIHIVGDPDVPPATDGPYVVGASEFTFTAPNVARYRCIDGRRIDITPLRGAAPGDIEAMLIATVLPALLWWRGEIVLHAAAFVLPGADGAIAIGGQSGAGKSTLLQRAIAAGAAVVGDDSVRVDFSPDRVAISGLPGVVFQQPSDATQHARIAIPVPPEKLRDAARLKAFVILDPAPSRPPGLWRLKGVDAVEAILKSRHRPRIAMLSGRAPALLPKLVSLARRVPIYVLAGSRGVTPIDPCVLAAQLRESPTS